MFFTESDLELILTCKVCNVRFDSEPRILPCGRSICNYCSKSIEKKFMCILCKNEHSLEDKELPINTEVKALLELQSYQVSRGRSHDQFEKTIKMIDSTQNEAIHCIENGAEFIKEYCLHLKNDLQLVKEEQIQSVEIYHNKMLTDIDEFMNEKIARLDKEKNNDLKNDIVKVCKELDSFSDRNKILLNEHKLDDDYLEKLNNDGKILIKSAKRKINSLEDFYFQNEKLTIQREKFRNAAKILKGNNILYPNEFEQLLELCKLKSTKWSLIYRASTDGFYASDFHRMCDHKANTLIVIKSTSECIFGGYTEKSWHGNNENKKDPYAFLFSFKNEENMPLLIPVKENCEYAIKCAESTGPQFGYSDLFISTESNIKEHSYSELCINSKNFPFYSRYSYQTDSYLAGSRHFKIKEIEVFTIV